jgi:hypothetical protein
MSSVRPTVAWKLKYIAELEAMNLEELLEEGLSSAACEYSSAGREEWRCRVAQEKLRERIRKMPKKGGKNKPCK